VKEEPLPTSVPYDCNLPPFQALGERAPDPRVSGSSENAPGKQGRQGQGGQGKGDTVDGGDGADKGLTYSTISRQDTQSKRNTFVKQGSILSNYFDEPVSRYELISFA
jgi:hypothetical protein